MRGSGVPAQNDTGNPVSPVTAHNCGWGWGWTQPQIIEGATFIFSMQLQF